ncbi:MAG TPA: secretin N-terminal domain-containing protein [Arenimonas sp.]|nr:secretin N-terminal domain-containing protein [Arenimonas sp.]
MNPHRVAYGMLALGLTLLAGCATAPSKPTLKPGLDLPPRTAQSAPDGLSDAPASTPRLSLQQVDTPKADVVAQRSSGLDDGERLPDLGTQRLKINAQDLPVPAFINEVFGDLLGLTVNMDSTVSKLQELVSLNTASGLPPKELFTVARNVLADYGVGVSVEDRVVRFAVMSKGASPTPPLVVSGRALPDVPVSHRPVFQLVELEVVRASDAQRWLSTVFGSEVTVRDEAGRNALLISGKPVQVKQALDALRVFDRPLMRGRISTRLEPAFLPADQLADRLVEVLTLQGYGISKSVSAPSSVIVLPVTAVNAVLVFATSQETLEYTVAWAKELDRVSPNAGTRSMFYYQVRNTKASDIASILNGGAAEATSEAPSATPAAGRQPARNNAAMGSRVVVDEPRNALIFNGDAADWQHMLTLIRQMDRAPRQVMIEVTIAEVTLDKGMQSGVQWFAKNGFGRFNGELTSGPISGGDSSDDTGSDNDSGGSGQSGLTYLLDVMGDNRATLTALANDSRVSILSTPRLLVKSGSEASIDVGTEIPTITMTTTSGQQTDGTSNLLQSVQYRKTGVILNISPTVYSDDRIDLDIDQQVSDAIALKGGETAGSPSIFNRAIKTSLSLRDGGSVVMAGLISERVTQDDSGVPYIKDIPLLGRLFKTTGTSTDRTELVLMIVPYIIESDDRATQVSQAIMEQFELLDLSTPTDE